MSDADGMTDDAKLMAFLLREQIAHPAWYVAERTAVDAAYADAALARLAGEADAPIIRRHDLGPAVYEATEDSAREW